MESITPSSIYHWQAPHSELFANYHWFRHSLRKGRDTLTLWPALTHIRHTHARALRHEYKLSVTLAGWQHKETIFNVPASPQYYQRTNAYFPLWVVQDNWIVALMSFIKRQCLNFLSPSAKKDPGLRANNDHEIIMKCSRTAWAA